MCKLARKGLTPSQIGVILRDSHGIAQVAHVTGSKILRILKKNGARRTRELQGQSRSCLGWRRSFRGRRYPSSPRPLPHRAVRLPGWSRLQAEPVRVLGAHGEPPGTRLEWQHAGLQRQRQRCTADLRRAVGAPGLRAVCGAAPLSLPACPALGLSPELPEDLYCLIKKAVSVRKHLDKFRQDKDAKFRLILIESRIHRIARYYKLAKALPPTFKYESATASTLVS